MKTKSFLLLLVALVASLHARAEIQVTVAFSLASSGEPIEGLAYRKNGAMQSLFAGEFERSRDYDYSGPERMDIYRMPASSEPGQTPRVVGSAVFDASVKRATLVLLPSGGKFEVIVIPEDADKFPAGHALLFNATRIRLGILCNQKDTVVLAPRERKLVARNDRGEIDALVAREQNGAWLSLSRSYVPVLEDQQTIIAFVRDPNDKDSVDFTVFRKKLQPSGADKEPQP